MKQPERAEVLQCKQAFLVLATYNCLLKNKQASKHNPVQSKHMEAGKHN